MKGTKKVVIKGTVFLSHNRSVHFVGAKLNLRVEKFCESKLTEIYGLTEEQSKIKECEKEKGGWVVMTFRYSITFKSF